MNILLKVLKQDLILPHGVNVSTCIEFYTILVSKCCTHRFQFKLYQESIVGMITSMVTSTVNLKELFFLFEMTSSMVNITVHTMVHNTFSHATAMVFIMVSVMTGNSCGCQCMNIPILLP